MSSRTSTLLAVGLVVVCGAAAVVLWLQRADRAPLPEDKAVVTPSSQFADPEAAAEYYRAVLRRDPDNVEAHVRLAHALMQLASQTGQGPTLIPEAQEHLAEALRLDPDHYFGQTLQASLYNTLHQFEKARDLAQTLLAQYPEHAYMHGVLVDALVELGDYDRAVEVSDRMLALRPGLPSYSRASYLRELHGDTDGAVAAMRLAADAEPPGRASRSWALYHLGELYLGQAKADTAAFLFQGILDETPGFAPALVGLGHVALVEGDLPKAVRLLDEARDQGSREPADALLTEVYTELGDEAKAKAAAERVLKSLHTDRATGEIVDMEEADFLADHDRELPKALRLAEGQIERRPGHLHANETYAWALYKNGRAAEAIPYIQRAMRLGSNDAMVHYRAGRIYEAAGRPAEAARQLRAALDAHVRIESPTAASHARTLLASLETTPVQATSAHR